MRSTDDYQLTTSAMNQRQMPVLPTAAQISVHSWVVNAGSKPIVRTGKPEGMVVSNDTQSSSESKLVIYKPIERDPVFTDTFNPNAVINEPANDIASRAIPWHLLFAQNQMLSGSSSIGAPQIGYETDSQSGTSKKDPDVQQIDQDARGT
ncbi:MAG: hypothetical protein EZS28_000929 [Streblomastix strix]|uniref:Uncharacterized protein n=1 Tax=Streblomastix strix TaxID=222440 RepID=A0A5J4XAL8_9EUKA|nr:MAG: hypothetical protein EZS28_000929 [Streblomastix strix]